MRSSSLLSFVSLGLLALHFSSNFAAGQAAAPAAAPEFFFHDGDTPAVILGDSITEQRMYSTLVETYVLSRYPTWKITFRNAGWSGDTAWLQKRGDFDKGLQRDVLSLQPKAVTIDFGMNDARGGDGTYQKYVDYSTKLVEDLKQAGARVALITPSPEEKYEPVQPGGSAYNLMLKKYSDGLKQVAAKENVPFVDQFTPFVKFIEAGRKAGVLGTQLANDPHFVRLTNEGVHPKWPGHLIMATAILQGLNAPALVSLASLNAATKATVAADGCTIQWQDAPAGSIQFSRTDAALPWPVSPECDIALKIPGFDPAKALDRYLLKVAGLTAPSYKLSIDDQDMGTYAKADLAAGVNLAFVRQGPIYDQEQKLLKAVIDKNNIYYSRWRDVQVFVTPDWLKSVPGIEEARTAKLAEFDQKLTAAEAAVEALRAPQPHVFKLEPAK